jgi:hypothetical protein
MHFEWELDNQSGEVGIYRGFWLAEEAVSDGGGDVRLQRDADDALDWCRERGIAGIGEYFSGFAGVAVGNEKLG